MNCLVFLTLLLLWQISFKYFSMSLALSLYEWPFTASFRRLIKRSTQKISSIQERAAGSVTCLTFLKNLVSIFLENRISDAWRIFFRASFWRSFEWSCKTVRTKDGRWSFIIFAMLTRLGELKGCFRWTTFVPSGSNDGEKGWESSKISQELLASAHAKLWDDPQATRWTREPSVPSNLLGVLHTTVDPVPCWPWSLSPQAKTLTKEKKYICVLLILIPCRKVEIWM